jgi:hypothetical protein
MAGAALDAMPAHAPCHQQELPKAHRAECRSLAICDDSADDPP